MTNAEARPPRILGPDGQPIPAPIPPRWKIAQQVLLSFVGSGIAMAVMGFLGRTWIERRFDAQAEMLRHDLARALRDESAKIAMLDTIEDRAYAIREAYSGVLSGPDKVRELNLLVGCAEKFQHSVGSRRSLLAKSTFESAAALVDAVGSFIAEVKAEGRPQELDKLMVAIENCLKGFESCVAQERTSLSVAAQPADAADRPSAGR